MRELRAVVLIEDSQADAQIVRRACAELKMQNPLIHFTDGEQAMNFLQNGGNAKPAVILLDLGIPVPGGIELLRQLKAEEDLADIPVVALTASEKGQDIAEAFSLGAAGYMVKPLDYADFLQKMSAIQEYWTLSELPRR